MSIRNVLSCLLFALPGLLRAQKQLYVFNNTNLVMKAPAKLVLNNTGFICDGNFKTDSSKVIFTGDSTDASNINGESAPNFYDIVISKSSGNVSVNGPVYVSHVVTMGSGNLLLNGYGALLLGTTGAIAGEREQSRIFGPGYISATFTPTLGQMSTPGNMGLSIASTVAYGTTTVTRSHAPVVLPNLVQSIGRVYWLSAYGSSMARTASPAIPLGYTIRFHYLDAELNHITEPLLYLWGDDAGSWNFLGKSSLDTSTNILGRTVAFLPDALTLGYSMSDARIAGPVNGAGEQEEPKLVKAGVAVVYPNPAHDRCTLTLSAASNINDVISLYNASGNVLQQKHVQLHSGANSIGWDLSAVPAGVYYIRSNNNTFTSMTITRL